MIIPAILEKDFNEVKNKVAQLDQHTSMFQIDIVDGKAVKGETFLNPRMLDQIQTDANFEVDLMVENPQEYVDERITSVFKICANIKAMESIPDFIQKAKELDYVVGISINPNTPVELVEPLLSQIDYVQFMGVEPGAQGRKIETKVLEKIKKFKKDHPFVEIQLDGGVTPNIIKQTKDLGIESYVVGSAIFNEPDPEEAYRNLKELVNDRTNNLFSIAE